MNVSRQSGIYRLATNVALVVSQAADGTLFSFRWGAAIQLCAPLFLKLQCLQTAAATATIFPRFQVFIARAFTTSDSAGTAITLTGNNLKKATTFPSTLVTDIRKSAVAAGLTVGTRTLDLEPVLELPTTQLITTPGTVLYTAEFDFTSFQEYPYKFDQNEGFIVRGPTTAFGLAGTADLVVELEWAEEAEPT